MSTLRLVLLFLGVILLSIVFAKEAFTSPGTMVQLASSHVPTQEDYNYLMYGYPKQVRHDLIDMTGGDPGDIWIPRPQLVSF